MQSNRNNNQSAIILILTLTEKLLGHSFKLNRVHDIIFTKYAFESTFVCLQMNVSTAK